MPSVLSTLKALKKFKNLKKITSGTWDKKPLEIVSYDVDVYSDRLTLDCTFKLDGQEHKVSAIHPWEEDDNQNEIKIDGAEVEEDDVDLDLDTHLLRIVLEYRLEYKKDNKHHTLVLRASSKTF